MRLTSCFVGAAALVGPTLGLPAVAEAANAAAVYDAETGFTFAEYKVAFTLTANIAFRVAVPSSAAAGQPYDVVVQVVVPNQVGWAGIAFGGSMTYNPLLVGWANGQQVQTSTRWATSHTQPSLYNSATLQKLTTGNRVNGSHWQYTAKCTGCTTYNGRSGTTTLNPKGSNRFALVISNSKPSQPASNTSNLVMHENPIYWTHSFTEGNNANFADLVRRNGGTTTGDTDMPTGTE